MAAAGLKSWWGALTKRQVRFGIVVKNDGSKVVLIDPHAAGYKSEDGGLFWVCQHKDGVYKLLASALYEYNEMTTQPSDGPAVTTTQHGVY